MLASEVVVLATALATFISTVATSSCCAYIFSRNDTFSIELVKQKLSALRALLDELNRKENGEAVVTPEQSDIITKAENVFARVDKSIPGLEEEIQSKCVSRLLPDLWAQKRARTAVEDSLSELAQVMQEAGSISGKPVKGYKQPTEASIVGVKRRQVRQDIWKLLLNGEAGLICIHGALGVGKTALAAAIHNQALYGEPQRFDYVIWVSLKFGAGLWQVQEDIARVLKVDLSEGGTRGGRAERLRSELHQKRKFLLILDSLWQPGLCLDEIGIPKLEGGRKLIVTSRIETVCDDMGSVRKFEVQALRSADEAWELFRDEMGSCFPECLEEETASSLKSALLAELDGLPLAICRLARTLGNRKPNDQNTSDVNPVWRKELAALEEKPISYIERRDPELLRRFEDSYKSLGEEARPCLLFCALFPKNHVIQSKELVEYWMWEGLLGDNATVQTLEKGAEDGTEILDELKNAHLLVGAGGGKGVTMPNLVRSMAIHTMDKVERRQVFIRSGSSLTRLPLEHEWPAEVEKASFMHSELQVLEMRGSPSCRRLSTLLLQDNKSLAKSHENFLHAMPNLRVLDLSRTLIRALPRTLSNSYNLHVLVLRGCKSLTKLPDLSRLKQLIVLDLWGTPLEDCPLGIAGMKRLRRLDLSQTRLKCFPNKDVSHLVELEELLMITEYNCTWRSTKDEQCTGACIEDLFKLGKLAVLHLHFLNAEAFETYVNTAEVYTKVPPKFRFRVGSVQDGEYPAAGNSLAIGGTAMSVLNTVALRKLAELNVLDVSNSVGAHSHLFKPEILGSLTKLRELHLRNCWELEELVGGQEWTGLCLPELTRMVLFDLPRLKSMCCGQVLNLPKLRSIHVWRCDNFEFPMKQCSLGMEVGITGERSWWDKHGNSNPYLRFVEAPVPPELTANWKDPQEGGDEEGIVQPQSTNDTIATTTEKNDAQGWFWDWLGST